MVKTKHIAIVFILLIANVFLTARANFGITHQDDEINITLSEEALNAIDNGVSLTFVSEFAVPKTMAFLRWNTNKKTHRFVVSKHALSDRYHLHKDDSPTPIIFRSSSVGVSQISKLIKKQFIEYSESSPNLELRVYLSKTELPAPLRMAAFASSQWDFDSGWGPWISADY